MTRPSDGGRHLGHPIRVHHGFFVLRGEGVEGVFFSLAEARSWVASRKGRGRYRLRYLVCNEVRKRWELRALDGGVRCTEIRVDGEGGEVR